MGKMSLIRIIFCIAGRSAEPDVQCKSASPSRLCKTRYNTTAPMYGISLTSGQPVVSNIFKKEKKVVKNLPFPRQLFKSFLIYSNK